MKIADAATVKMILVPLLCVRDSLSALTLCIGQQEAQAVCTEVSIVMLMVVIWLGLGTSDKHMFFNCHN